VKDISHKGTTGQRIAWLRRKKGYTQGELASCLHISSQAISKWENGNALPDTTLLPDLARALGTSIDRILTGADFSKPTGPYDKEYGKTEFYWGLEHSWLAETLVTLVQKESRQRMHLLDIGSGEGRDAIYFAKCGLIVDALEISLPGIEKIKRYSRLAGYPVNTIHADFNGYEFVNDYDVVYSMGSLQFLLQQQRQEQFEQYKKHTRSGGYHAHFVFVEKPFIAVAPDWQDNEFFYRSGDLAAYYHDWEIVVSGETIIDCNSSNTPHTHAASYLIAKKP
jgi:tellurite methyltransferase